VLPDATIDVNGNTRTGESQEKSGNDVVKTITVQLSAPFTAGPLSAATPLSPTLVGPGLNGEAIYKRAIGK
jgi:hypothetical protein